MRILIVSGLVMLASCGEPEAANEPANSRDEQVSLVSNSTSLTDDEHESTFFPLASADANTVAKCRAAALAFDTNRRIEMAEKVVAACEKDAAGIGDADCKMYAVRVGSAASKFVHQMKMIEANNPAWQGMTDVIRDHNERAKEFARRCMN